MARYPGARWRPVARYQPGGSSNQPMTRYDGGVDHTYVGSPSSDAAFARFNTPGNPIPHFMVFRDGSIDQYVDTKFRASACLDGNPRLIAWETADGFPSLWSDGQAPKDTPEMVQAKAKLMVWLNKTHGIPLVRMPSSKPSARGMGWHRLGIDGNFEQKPGQLLGGRVAGGEKWSESFGKTCPTSRRIHQFVEETIPAAVTLANPPAPAPTLNGAQISLRFDVDPEQVATYIAGGVQQFGLDFFTTTEGKGRRRAVRRRLGKAWRVQSRGEYLIGTRKAALARRLTLPLPVLRIVQGADWTNGPHSGVRHFAVMFSNFKHKATGKRLRLMAVHATSGVQAGPKWANLPTRVLPYKLGVRRLGKWVAKPGAKVAQVVGMDSNLDQHLQVWRDFLEQQIGLPSMWHDGRPTGGSHGHRLIDTMHTNLPVSGQGVANLKRDPGLDHRLVHATFQIGRTA